MQRWILLFIVIGVIINITINSIVFVTWLFTINTYKYLIWNLYFIL